MVSGTRKHTRAKARMHARTHTHSCTHAYTDRHGEVLEAIDGISVKDWEEKNIKSLLMDAGSFEDFAVECPFPCLLSVHMRTQTNIHVSRVNAAHACRP